jgi:hypothetical protein
LPYKYQKLKEKTDLFEKDTDYSERVKIPKIGISDVSKAKLSGMTERNKRFCSSNPYKKKLKLPKDYLGFESMHKSQRNPTVEDISIASK